MKKIFLCALLCAVGLLSCSKKEESTANTDTTVTYEFSSDKSGTFLVTWSDEFGLNQAETFTGTSWSKTVVTNQKKGFTWAANAYHNTAATDYNKFVTHAGIKINNITRVTNDYTFDSSHLGFAMKWVLFK